MVGNIEVNFIDNMKQLEVANKGLRHNYRRNRLDNISILSDEDNYLEEEITHLMKYFYFQV